MSEKEFRESWGLTSKTSEEVEQSVNPSQPTLVSTEPVTATNPILEKSAANTFTDEDILNHTIDRIKKAINLSRGNEFKPVAFTFEELDFLLKVAVTAKERTNRFNALMKNLINRDSALIHNVGQLAESLQVIKQQAEQMSVNVEQTSLVSKHFIKTTNENN